MEFNTNQLAYILGQFGGLVIGILLIALVVSLLIWGLLVLWRKCIGPEAERVFGDGNRYN